MSLRQHPTDNLADAHRRMAERQAVRTAQSQAASGRLPNERREQLTLFASGCLAALVTVAAMLFVREFSESRSLVELVAEAILQLMPISLFSFLLQLLQQSAKPMLLMSVILGMIVIGGGIARLDGGPARAMSRARRAKRIALIALGIWVPLAIFALLVTSSGTAATTTNRELVNLGISLFAVTLGFTATLYMLYPLVNRALAPTTRNVDRPPSDLSRRRFLAQAGTASIAVAGVGYLGRFLNSIGGGAVGGERNAISGPITSNDDFYLISKNFVDPSVDGDDWSLEISGLVERPYRLRYEDLPAFPLVEQLTTLTCISNEIGGDLISNARWTGTSLANILARAGVRPEAGEIAIYADDGYTESIALSKALSETTLLVHLMNGEPLPKRHGYPARLIVPGLYGIKNVKWITRIDLVSGNFKGYWQQRGWTDTAIIKTMSRFDIPGSRAIVPAGPMEIGGVAFAGDRGISQVEYTDDGGQTWRAVDQLERVAPLSWAIWRSTWNPTRAGTYTLTVRATDGQGNVQPEERSDPIPTGASGYHSVVVGVT